MTDYDICPSCGCDGVRPYEPFHHIGWQRLDGRCRQCGTHPAEYEAEQLTKRVERLEKALAMVAWHAVAYGTDDQPVCTACAARDTKHDNCPVMGAVERLESPHSEQPINPLAPVVEALLTPVYVSRLIEDIPSKIHPGHVHVAGTEFAPIRCMDGRMVEIEIRVLTNNGLWAWYEKMVIDRDKTELVQVAQDRAS
jgi:hypothetical protein